MEAIENKTIEFRRDDPKNLAIFLAQIVREGLTYKIENGELFVKVELTGGF